MDDLDSIMALVELDLRAAVDRYLPEFVALEEDGVTVIDMVGGRVSDEAADRFEAEIRTIVAFHLPPGSRFEIAVQMVASDGHAVRRRIAGEIPLHLGSVVNDPHIE